MQPCCWRGVEAYLADLLVQHHENLLQSRELLTSDGNDLGAGQLEPELLQCVAVQSVPIIDLACCGIACAVLWQLNKSRTEVMDELGHQHTVAEVAPEVSPGARVDRLVHPCPQLQKRDATRTPAFDRVAVCPAYC